MGNRRIQLSLSDKTRELLDFIKEDVEAESYGEVIRRGLILLERYPLALKPVPKQHGCTSRLQITLPDKSVERLKHLESKYEYGSQIQVIRQALYVFKDML